MTNVDEEGTIDIPASRQPQVGQALTALASDPDNRDAGGEDTSFTFDWEWSVPKVARPVLDNDKHWTPAANPESNGEDGAYMPLTGDVGSFLRAQVTYTDGTDEERTLNILTEFAVRAEPADNDLPNAFDSADDERNVDENSMNGTLVGAPVATTDSNPGDVLTYTIPPAGDANPFVIDKKTGQISVAGTVHHEEVDSNGVTYMVTVTATDPSGET